ncbi:hypothetical protein [Shewanella sp. SM95]|uniref:hypothetical protein n=1 Tax=Shewanella sp. SM95 TaxID=2912812 RepID=UPI0021D8D531|nr:hypothetical protein [Shewanella sp. SM95]MCU7998855.1 hypothetical protein [Shewanella sp. SM95]
MQSPISIGCECGGPEDGGISCLKVELFHTLEKHVTSTHCDSVDQYALVLRVDGEFAKYGLEGVHRVRFAKKSRYLTADIQIPESVWRLAREEDLRLYLGSSLRSAIEILVARLKKAGIAVVEISLYTEMNVAITEFTQRASAANYSL